MTAPTPEQRAAWRAEHYDSVPEWTSDSGLTYVKRCACGWIGDCPTVLLLDALDAAEAERDEARAELETLRDDMAHQVRRHGEAIARAEKAEAEADRLREDAATFEQMFREAQRHAVAHRERANTAKARAIDAEAAIARVRALCDEDGHAVDTGTLLAALDGGDDRG